MHSLIFVFILGDPHSLKGAKRRQDGTSFSRKIHQHIPSNPSRILSLRRSINTNLDVLRSTRLHLIQQTTTKTYSIASTD